MKWKAFYGFSCVCIHYLNEISIYAGCTSICHQCIHQEYSYPQAWQRSFFFFQFFFSIFFVVRAFDCREKRLMIVVARHNMIIHKIDLLYDVRCTCSIKIYVCRSAFSVHCLENIFDGNSFVENEKCVFRKTSEFRCEITSSCLHKIVTNDEHLRTLI